MNSFFVLPVSLAKSPPIFSEFFVNIAEIFEIFDECFRIGSLQSQAIFQEQKKDPVPVMI